MFIDLKGKKCLCWKGLLLRMISHVCGSCSEWVTTCVWSCSRWHVFVEPSPVHSFQTVISSGWVMSCVDWSCPRLPLFDQPVFWPASLFGSLLFSTTDLVRASPFDQPVCLAVYCLVLLTFSGPPPLTSQSVWQCYWSYQPHPTPTPLDQPVCLAVLLILSAPSPPPPPLDQPVCLAVVLTLSGPLPLTSQSVCIHSMERSSTWWMMSSMTTPRLAALTLRSLSASKKHPELVPLWIQSKFGIKRSFLFFFSSPNCVDG